MDKRTTVIKTIHGQKNMTVITNDPLLIKKLNNGGWEATPTEEKKVFQYIIPRNKLTFRTTKPRKTPPPEETAWRREQAARAFRIRMEKKAQREVEQAN